MWIARKILLLTMSIMPVMAFCQSKITSNQKSVFYSVSVGTGWTHYYNNLEYADSDISADFAGVSFRFLWEPEYRLSVGFESGLYHLFKVRDGLSALPLEADRAVIPFMLLARMRIVANFYLGTGFGVALITNRIKTDEEQVKTATWSLSNYLASAGYVFPLNEHLQIGAEIKVYNYGSLNDWMHSLQVICTFRF